MLFKYKLKWGKGVLCKAAPVDFSGAVAGGWADGGWWMESGMKKRWEHTQVKTICL